MTTVGIAETFESAGLPAGFHRSAAELYARLEAFKIESPALDAVIAALLGEPGLTQPGPNEPGLTKPGAGGG